MMSKKKSLLNFEDSDSEPETFNKLQINQNYAERYDKWRGSEEMQKLKDRYGDVEEDSESSTSEEEWTDEKEKEFFKTFSLLKQKDPKIYDANVRFFKSTEEPKPPAGEAAPKSEKKGKTFLIKDHERKMILEKGASYVDEEEEEIDVKPEIEPSYVQEQANIKKGFSDALKTIDSDEEGDDYSKSDLLKKRKKTVKEEQVEDDDYRQWLKGEVVKIKKEKVKDELKFLKEYWNDPKLNEDEKFLRDYILNRKYREIDDSNHIPSYDEIVHDSDEEGLSGDEEHVQKMEDFEHKYNFRFEEPDPDFIKRYPRTVESSMRRAEDKRKRQRESAKERKDAEKEKKREEIQRLKALKRNEILEKLKQLENITGEPNLNFEDEDIEGDFDPEAHDKRMQKIFDEEYYGHGDEEKPVFPSDDELDEEWKAYCPSEEEDESDDGKEESQPETSKKIKKKKKSKQPESVEDEGTNEPQPGPSSRKSNVVDELIEASKGKRGKKKKTSVFLEALERSKPKFNPEAYKSYEEYFEEYYNLDFEDLIGDIPCRFKYRKVTPNNFGLSFDEIINAPDRELNQWASLKKTYQYRTPEEEKYDLQAYMKKADSKMKQKIMPSLFKNADDAEDDEQPEEPVTVEETGPKKKKKNKKKKKKNNSEQNNTLEPLPEIPEITPPPNTTATTPATESKKKRKRKSKNKSGQPSENAEKSVIEPPSTPADETKEPQKKQKKKQHSEESNETMTTPEQSKNTGKKRKHQFDSDKANGNPHAKKMKDQSGKKSQEKSSTLDDDRLRAYGINPTKYKKQLKYGNKK